MSPHLRTLAAGAALVLAANGIALTGVACNRSGEPDSRVALSGRELEPPWAWQGGREDSGLALNLKWRVPERDADRVPAYYGASGGRPAWLDETRLAALGFDVERARDGTARGERYRRHAERPVLVVLELAGSDWVRAVEGAARHLARQQILLAAKPDDKRLIETEQAAREALAREQDEHSRLFAVDVGTELASLRAQYPDRSRHLILKGSLGMQRIMEDGKATLVGHLNELRIQRINVPHALRGELDSPAQGAASVQAGVGLHFTAVVAVGQRLEPWIESISRPVSSGQ